jgi:hypothetical protein
MSNETPVLLELKVAALQQAATRRATRRRRRRRRRKRAKRAKRAVEKQS